MYLKTITSWFNAKNRKHVSKFSSFPSTFSVMGSADLGLKVKMEQLQGSYLANHLEIWFSLWEKVTAVKLRLKGQNHEVNFTTYFLQFKSIDKKPFKIQANTKLQKIT